MKILAIAADAFEARPWLQACPAGEPCQWPLPYAQRAAWNGHTLFAVANGPGPGLSTAALELAVKNAGPFDALCSIGLCGALDPDLAHNAICSATEVSDGSQSWPALPLPGATPIRLLSLDRFLAHPDEKRQWHNKGYAAIEMEAAPLARYAARNHIPFYAVKSVSDLASDSFSLDFNQFRDPDGRFQKNKIALAALRNPFRYIPDLYRIGSRGFAAAHKLGEFLVQSKL